MMSSIILLDLWVKNSVVDTKIHVSQEAIARFKEATSLEDAAKVGSWILVFGVLEIESDRCVLDI